MEDVKWLVRKCGIPLLILFLLLVTVIFVRKGLSTKEREAEVVWEPPVEIENNQSAEKVSNDEVS